MENRVHTSMMTDLLIQAGGGGILLYAYPDISWYLTTVCSLATSVHLSSYGSKQSENRCQTVSSKTSDTSLALSTYLPSISDQPLQRGDRLKTSESDVYRR